MIALGQDGTVLTGLFSNNAWGPVTPLAGARDIDGVSLLNNPQRASGTILLRSKTDGALSASTATGDKPFGDLAALNLKAQFAPVAVVDSTTGTEHFLAVEAGTRAASSVAGRRSRAPRRMRRWPPPSRPTRRAFPFSPGMGTSWCSTAWEPTGSSARE